MKLVLVNGDPAPVRRRDELFFLRAALAPSGITSGRTFDVSEVSPSEFEKTDLAGADVLALCNVPRLSTGAWTKIRHFVSTGHGLIVFAGDKVQPESYRPLAEGDAPLLPCRIGPPVRPAKPARLEPGELRGPVLRAFRSGRNGDLASARFHTYARLEPAEKAGADVMLAYKNGDPALVSGRYGTGRVLVFGSSCDADWTDLPRAVPYVVLMHESIRFLNPGEEETRDVVVGGAPLINISAPQSVKAVKLWRVAGPESDDAADPLDVTEQLDKRSGRLSVAPVEEPGVYRIVVDRTGDAPDDEMYFAANLDTAESDLTRLPDGAVQNMLPGWQVKVARTPAELREHISRGESQDELSSDFAGIMLALLLAEMFLSNHMRSRVKRSGKEGQEPEQDAAAAAA
jgi:hypothetical protein